MSVCDGVRLASLLIGLMTMVSEAFSPNSGCCSLRCCQADKSVSSCQAASRRRFLLQSGSIPLVLTRAPRDSFAAKRPACGDIDTCREQGQKKFEASEIEKGPIVRLDGGVSYRELSGGVGPGAGQGDVVDIAYQVLKGNGFYMYSLGLDKEPGQRDLGETYRLTVGRHEVPVAVEMALEGAKKGAVRRVEMPPRLGFQTSHWSPQPQTFEGKQRMEGYRKLLAGNGLQPGYAATLLFEFTVVKIRPGGASKSDRWRGGAEGAEGAGPTASAPARETGRGRDDMDEE